MKSNKRMLMDRISSADSANELRKIEKSLDRVYDSFQLTEKEYVIIDLKIFEKLCAIDCM